MATFAIGDIHGCWGALQALLDVVPISNDDQVIGLGDYVDRGPDSNRVLQWVMDQHADHKLIALRGNHEVMMEASLNGQMNAAHWLACGGKETLQSYTISSQNRLPKMNDVPDLHRLFLEQSLLSYYETNTHIFVHACVLGEYALDQQDEHTFYWSRFEDIGPHDSGKTVICGHTAQKSGRPANNGHAICIDTWVYGSGWLTCLNVESGQYWQANQKGKTRSDWLEFRN